MTAKEFSEMENLMKLLSNAKELAQIYTLLEYKRFQCNQVVAIYGSKVNFKVNV